MHQQPLAIGVAAVLLSPTAHAPDSGPAASSGSLGTILIVDDDAVLRMLFVKFLTLVGYTALEVRQGSDALTLARSHPARIDLLITDVVMPGMSGFELAPAFLEIHPETQVLYMTGHASEVAEVGRAVEARPDMFMIKPFWVEQLLERIRHILSGPGSRSPS